jgi:CheY-like chemotaxis protein
MSKGKVLIIDDDIDIVETTGALLEFEGFEVHSADNVEEGIAMIETVSPDIVLLDIMFPEKKTRGFEAANEIKDKHPQLPILAFTAININSSSSSRNTFRRLESIAAGGCPTV